MVRLGMLDVAPGMSSQRGWVFLATGLHEGAHEREHEEQDMRSEWFTATQIEEMIRCGAITDAQTIAAWAMVCSFWPRQVGKASPIPCKASPMPSRAFRTLS